MSDVTDRLWRLSAKTRSARGSLTTSGGYIRTHVLAAHIAESLLNTVLLISLDTILTTQDDLRHANDFSDTAPALSFLGAYNVGCS
jgi:hypothetical protein